MTAAQNPKDVVYVDVDDEITAIIEKVRDSSGKIVALVLPKRAAVFQSIVNMRLLKRTADAAKKHIVLVTSEPGLLPLAGAVGIHVAKTAQSKPVIPPAPQTSDAPVTVNEIEVEDASGNNEDYLDPNASIGELAGLPLRDQEETIEVDNEEPDDIAAAAAATETIRPAKKPFNRKLKVPNFDKFRTRLFLGVGLLILLIIGWYAAFYVMPRAKITIKTDTVSVTSNLNITASPSAETVDAEDSIVPGLVKELTKSDSQKVQATGQKDVGTKAKGSVELALTDCSQPEVTIPSGTGVSSNNLTFITQTSVTLISTIKGGKCSNDADARDTVAVVAQNAGDQYNLSARSYAVAGFSNVSASGTAMSGGTSQIVKIVTQQDIDSVKQKIQDANSKTAAEELNKQLKAEGYTPLSDTIRSSEPLVTSNPAVNQEATEATVSVVTKYTMVGAQEEGIKQLVEADIKKKIDTSKQTILDNGIEKAVIRINDKKDNGQTTFNIQVAAAAGVQQDSAEAIKKAVAGKKRGETQNIIKGRPGIKEVSVKYSPFWVYKTPNNPGKIDITFQQSDGATSQ